MSARDLYDIWIQRIRKLLPDERATRLRNLCMMIVGMHHAQSIHLSEIACHLPMKATVPSTTRRLRRFIDNSRFRARVWYQPIVQELLARRALSGGPVRLIIDGSKVGAGHQLLMVAEAYRSRALPIAWTWVKGARGHSSASTQLMLLRYVRSLIPKGVDVILVGDSEFGTVTVAQELELWGWSYVLRQKGNTQVSISRTKLDFQNFRRLVTCFNKIVWHPNAIVTLTHFFHTNLLGYWNAGEDDPWLLITNLPTASAALRAYRYRMWIEEMFGDWKGHGVELERTHLRTPERLTRLVFIVALHYQWLVTRGSQTIKSGQRHLVDRPDRRDLSIYRIGLYIIFRRRAHGQAFSIRLIPYF